MQIVIGLLTDDNGYPISVEIFRGNTNDITTFLPQVKKLAEDFGIENITMVGDRGMIKRGQVKDLKDHHYHYITALTKPQIETLLKKEIIDMDLFDEDVCEIENNKIRYVLRRNPVRVEEIEKNRQSKIKKIKSKIANRNNYLDEHLKASVTVAAKKIKGLIKRLKLDKFIFVEVHDQERTLEIKIDEEKKNEVVLLDGCYVIKTDLTKEQANTEIVHQRYKDLAMVEYGFRTMKTGLLETRPIYVRLEKRTRGHVFVVMLGYSIVRELKELWKEIEMTVEEGIESLTTLCSIEINIKGTVVRQIPSPDRLNKIVLKKADIILPEVLPSRKVTVSTRKKLVSERKC